MKKGRKISGGRYIQSRKKKLYELPGQKRTVKLGEENKIKSKRTRGANKKTFLTIAKFVNVVDNKKVKKMPIKNVIETPSNRFLARQNIITKGTIVLTDDEKKIRITNRPSQEGVLNGIFVE
jgi:small subunit ribosomal protein S8e